MNSPAMTLLVLPCAGASASLYLRWRRQLPAWLRLVPVELPGRGARMGEPFAKDFEALVEQLCEEYAEELQGRYALFGHSMGALLAYGMAHYQRGEGRPMPRTLFVSACPAPSRQDSRRFPDRNDDALIADLRKQGGTPEAVFDSPELLRLTLDALGADYRVCESFRYRSLPALPVPFHVLAGRDDDIADDRLEAWRRETANRFSLDWFGGGHFYLRDQEAELLNILIKALSPQLAPPRVAGG